MNICILSNSHAASLKDGWEAIADKYPSLNLTFFAAANRGMLKVRADHKNKTFSSEDTQITAMLAITSGGLEIINVADYDAFFVYGLFLSYPRLDVRLSNAVKSLAIKDGVEGSINFRLIKELSKMTSAPVFYGAEPLWSDGSDELVESASPDLHTFTEISNWVNEYYAEHSATKILQPLATIGNNLDTVEEYSAGSRRLNSLAGEAEYHKNRDIKHANSKYGARYLEESLLPDIINFTSLAA